MGDIIAIKKEETLHGSLIFAKNSSHSPNEAFLTLRVEAKDFGSGGRLRTSTIEIPQASHTYGMVIQKPKWCWGAEVGMNEKGLSVGCETVATKATPRPVSGKGLIGNDICRLVLERAASAKEGASLVIELFERHGHCSWAPGSLDARRYRDYSYMIADRDDIYVIETAGPHWVMKIVSEDDRMYAISNMLTITANYDERSDSVARLEKGGQPVNWSKTFGRPLAASFEGAPVRRYAFYDSALTDLEGPAMKASKFVMFDSKGMRHGDGVGVSYHTFIRALRRHMRQNMDRPSQPCTHFGDNKKSLHTVGSFISAPGLNMICATASSTPCRSIFKPIFLGGRTPFFTEGQETEAERYWIAREIVTRSSYAGLIEKERLRNGIEDIEYAYDKLIEDLDTGSPEELSVFNAKVWDYDEKFVAQYLRRSGKTVRELRPNISTIFFKALWGPYNRALLERAHDIGGIL